MQKTFGKCWLAANMLIFALLIGAETAGIAHPYAHEFGVPADLACASCAIAGQLAAACPAPGSMPDRAHPDRIVGSRACPADATDVTLPVRQRGPPPSS